MKTKLLLQSVCMLLMLFGFQFCNAFDGGSIMGRITDPDTKAPGKDLVVVIECLGHQTVVATNDSGYYYASNLPAGVYTVTTSYQNGHAVITDIKLTNGDQKIVDIDLKLGVTLTEIPIYEHSVYHPKVIDPYEITTGRVERSEFTKEPITKVADITAQQPGVTDINGVFYVKGAREGGLAYYVDGGPAMNGGNNIPLCGLDVYEIYTGFIPPKYGDTEGGVVVLETRNYFTASH